MLERAKKDYDDACKLLTDNDSETGKISLEITNLKRANEGLLKKKPIFDNAVATFTSKLSLPVSRFFPEICFAELRAELSNLVSFFGSIKLLLKDSLVPSVKSWSSVLTGWTTNAVGQPLSGTW